MSSFRTLYGIIDLGVKAVPTGVIDDNIKVVGILDSIYKSQKKYMLKQVGIFS
jgi:hypothetical protein